MSTQENMQTIGSLTASADLSAKQYRVMKVSGVNTVTVQNGSSNKIVGILQNAPPSGSPATLAISGVSKVVTGAAVTAGDMLMSDANGKAITASGNGVCVLGVALETAGGADEYIRCLISLEAGGITPSVAVLTQTFSAAAFVDGGGTTGTKAFTGTIPAGAMVLYSKVLVPAGFAGDTTATLTIGDGSDVDRYNTGTPSIFATAATGVEVGVPSGAKLQIAAVSPVLTVTSSADFTSVISNGTGSVTVSIYYIPA